MEKAGLGNQRSARHVQTRFRLGAMLPHGILVESERFLTIIMAPTSRIAAIASRAPLCTTSHPSYTCLQCRLVGSKAAQKSNPSSIHLPSRRHASSFINSEKWRKKIWGSNPPGQKDPYGAPGALDQRAKEQVVEDPESAEQVDASEEELGDMGEGVAEDPDYKRATTWEGLESVGYSSWGKEQFSILHPFGGFVDVHQVVNGQANLVL